jgi:hypothetical protein
LNDQGAEISLGSGFIAADGRVVTNRHVIEGGSRAEVFGSEGQLLGTAPYAEAMSTEMDIAVLPAIPDAPGRLGLAPGIPAIGSPIIVVGAPKGLENTVSEGIISAVRQLNPGRVIQISAPISPGSSGGPVLDHTGDVVGIAYSQITDGQNLNFAIPAEAIRAVLGSPPGKLAFPRAAVATTPTPTPATASVQPSSPPAPPAQASTMVMSPRWTVVQNTERIVIGVDTSHAQVDEELHRFYTVWVRFQYSQDGTTPDGHRFRAMIGRWVVDCRDRKFRTLNGIFYSSDGTVVQSLDTGNTPWVSPVPETIGEGAMNGVCTVLRTR